MQLIVNTSRQEYLSPIPYRNPLSLPLMGQGDNHILMALAFLLDSDKSNWDIMAGSWIGDSIEIVSDEDNEGVDISGRNQYEIALDEYNDVTEEVMEAVGRIYDLE